MDKITIQRPPPAGLKVTRASDISSRTSGSGPTRSSSRLRRRTYRHYELASEGEKGHRADWTSVPSEKSSG